MAGKGRTKKKKGGKTARGKRKKPRLKKPGAKQAGVVTGGLETTSGHLHRMVPKPIEHHRTFVHHGSPHASKSLRLAEGGVMATLIVLFFSFVLHYFGLSSAYIPIMSLTLWAFLVAIFYHVLEG